MIVIVDIVQGVSVRTRTKELTRSLLISKLLDLHVPARLSMHYEIKYLVLVVLGIE